MSTGTGAGAIYAQYIQDWMNVSAADFLKWNQVLAYHVPIVGTLMRLPHHVRHCSEGRFSALQLPRPGNQDGVNAREFTIAPSTEAGACALGIIISSQVRIRRLRVSLKIVNLTDSRLRPHEGGHWAPSLATVRNCWCFRCVCCGRWRMGCTGFNTCIRTAACWPLRRPRTTVVVNRGRHAIHIHKKTIASINNQNKSLQEPLPPPPPPPPRHPRHLL